MARTTLAWRRNRNARASLSPLQIRSIKASSEGSVVAAAGWAELLSSVSASVVARAGSRIVKKASTETQLLALGLS